MGIENKSGGKAIGRRKEGPFQPAVDTAEGQVGHPGSILGDARLRLLLACVAQLQHKLPSVEWLRIIFKEYNDLLYLLLIPLALKVTAEEAKKIKEENPDFYRLRIRRGAPEITGLAGLYADAEVPLREDQWYICEAKVINDAEEGYVVALNWTGATTKERDIAQERRQKSEAAKRRREQKKQAGGGATDPAAAGSQGA
jgi:hypothetical protein